MVKSFSQNNFLIFPAAMRLLSVRNAGYLDHFESLAGGERNERDEAADLIDPAADADDVDNADEEENG